MRTLRLLVCVSILFTGCAKRESSTIRVDGATTVLPIISKAAELLQKENQKLKILINAGGSGVGINLLGSKKIDLGMISRDITEAEKLKFKGTDFVVHNIGIDAVIPCVSSEIYNAGVTALTLEQIGKIYKGEIRNWKELGGPNKDILVIDKEKSRGTRHVFMEIVLGDKEAVAPGADLVLGSNNEEQGAVIESDAAIGMLSLAWLNDDVKGLSVIGKDNAKTEPTLANVKNRKFPLIRNLQIITDGAPTGDLKKFIDFIKSPAGQQIVEEKGYVKIHE